MSDRTYFQMTVHACPPEQAVALGNALWAIDAFDGVEDMKLDPTQPLPWRVTAEEVVCGTVDAIDVEQLIAAAPDAAWQMWEDPKYEWSGVWLGYHPEVGYARCDCDTDGNETVTYWHAKAVFEADTPTLAALFPTQAIRDKLQGPQ